MDGTACTICPHDKGVGFCLGYHHQSIDRSWTNNGTNNSRTDRYCNEKQISHESVIPTLIQEAATDHEGNSMNTWPDHPENCIILNTIKDIASVSFRWTRTSSQLLSCSKWNLCRRVDWSLLFFSIHMQLALHIHLNNECAEVHHSHTTTMTLF